MYASAAYPSHSFRRFAAGVNGIHLVHDTDRHGWNAYYFLQVNQWQKRRFLRDIAQNKPLDLSDYGEILHSAYGEEPPEEVLALMQEKYGWEG